MTQDYAKTTSRGKIVAFISQRTRPDIQVPRYVFDLWLPLLGVDAIGVYSTYCRLEHSGIIHGMTMEWIAHQLRVGVPRLREINKMLEDCGFILVCKPIGAERLVHLCTTIVVKDAPSEVSAALLAKYQSEIWGYQPLIPKLVEQVEVEPPPEPRRGPIVDAACGASYFVDRMEKENKCETDAPEPPNGRSPSIDIISTIPNTDEESLPINEDHSNSSIKTERPNGRSLPAKRDNSAVAFSTPGAAFMVEFLTKEGKALGRSPAGKFPSVTAKERFEAAEQRLGLEALRKVLGTFFTKVRYPSINQIVGYVEKAASNESGGNGQPPPTANLDPALYGQIVTSLRLNPLVCQKHKNQAERLTYACMVAGYTVENVRKFGVFWWRDDWRGKQGTGPKDDEFIQAVEGARKERW